MAAHTYNGAARGVSMKKKKPRLILKIVHYLIIITAFLVVVFLVLSLGFRSAAIHEAVRKDAEVLFVQTRQAFAAMDNTKDEINGKNTFSYIFTLLKTDSDTDLYAVDPGTGKIVGSTSAEMIGKRPAEIGLPMPDVSKGTAAEHGTVNGRYSYCVFSMAGDHIIVYVVPRTVVYRDLVGNMLVTCATLLIVVICLVASVSWYMNRYVVRNIRRINESLTEISKGNLDKHIEVENTEEFSELSAHINEMIDSLLGTTDVLSYIINRTGSRVGVYVYNSHMSTVRFTDYIPELFSLDAENVASIFSDYRAFQSYIVKLRKNPLAGETNIYQLPGDEERYIRIDEAMHQGDVLGVVVDMTEEIEKRRQIETESDLDLLTGLLNRRGLKRRLTGLFKDPEALGFGAIFLIDADNLKFINDRYGHDHGDRYLMALANLLRGYGSKKNVAARLGGDEYVLFLYGYDDEKTLEKDIRSLQKLQDFVFVDLDADTHVLLQFSLGYALSAGSSDHSSLLKIADEMMYENKRQRKHLRGS